MDNSTRTINIQSQSFGNYLQDIWLIALVFVLIYNQTTVNLPLIWLLLQMVIALTAFLIFRKTGPSRAVPFIIPPLILLLLFVFGAPFWLFGLASIFSIWRMQVRFNTLQEEQTMDSGFTLLFLGVFLGAHFISFVLGYEGYRIILYTILLTGIALFFGIRFFTVTTGLDKHNSLTKTKVLRIYAAIMAIVVSLSITIYFIAPFIRGILEFLLGGLVRILLVPLRPLINYLEKVLDGMEIRQMEEGERERIPIGQQDTLEPKESTTEGLATNFPVEWILLGIAIIVIIVVLHYLLKNRPEKIEIKHNDIHYENEQMSEEEEQKKPIYSLYQVETSILREKYAQFELEAHAYELERNKSETAREWFKRMEWQVENEFFEIYEEVRYGGRSISSEKAELFIKSLEKIKEEKFLKKEV
ncbi:DUF4129 domain-containing protein [Bacillus sp. FJAT-22090]|uniref:DUF4129 domain-containing protein n=1 Tax=Bacillus sp. FJAT-22090 TaxID=1581038 RepID=UPI0011A383B9|nr:DUF4129 domain-containing protein [Bacillus sp. FJAT-22090]